MAHAPATTVISPAARNPPRAPQIDPFGKVNLKARKVIESVERQRQTPADPRVGSTVGSFDDEIDFNNKKRAQAKPTPTSMNNTA